MNDLGLSSAFDFLPRTTHDLPQKLHPLVLHTYNTSDMLHDDSWNIAHFPPFCPMQEARQLKET